MYLKKMNNMDRIFGVSTISILGISDPLPVENKRKRCSCKVQKILDNIVSNSIMCLSRHPFPLQSVINNCVNLITLFYCLERKRDEWCQLYNAGELLLIQAFTRAQS